MTSSNPFCAWSKTPQQKFKKWLKPVPTWRKLIDSTIQGRRLGYLPNWPASYILVWNQGLKRVLCWLWRNLDSCRRPHPCSHLHSTARLQSYTDIVQQDQCIHRLGMSTAYIRSPLKHNLRHTEATIRRPDIVWMSFKKRHSFDTDLRNRQMQLTRNASHCGPYNPSSFAWQGAGSGTSQVNNVEIVSANSWA